MRPALSAAGLGLSRARLRAVGSTLFYMWQSAIVSFANCLLISPTWRGAALRAGRVRTAGPTLIYRGIVVQGQGRLTVGSDSFINSGCYFDTVADIEIGARVYIADHVRVITSSHEIGQSAQRAGLLYGKSVKIGDGSWIGSGTLIMPGVEIGSGCVIGARSLVTKDCAADSVYVGSPAVRVRGLS